MRGVVDGIVISDDGTLARAMEVLPVDLSMMAQGKRERYRMMFSRAIAAIRDPVAIQIVIASRPQTCKRYLKRLKERAQRMARKAALTHDTQPDLRRRRERLAERALRTAAFVETQLSFVRPLEEQYLVVVWHNPFPIKVKRRVLTQKKFHEGQEELARRFNLVRSVMQDADLATRALGDQEILAVIYRFYHFPLSPLGAGVEPRVRAIQPSLYVDTGDARGGPEERDPTNTPSGKGEAREKHGL